MAKKISGERSLKVGKETYTLRFGFDEMGQVEDRYGPFNAIQIEISSGKARYTLLAFILSEMARIPPTEAFAILMEYPTEALTCIVEVIMATVNPENKKGRNSGE